MPHPAQCWLCPLVHRDPRKVFVCRQCHEAMCIESVRIVTGLRLVHRDFEDDLCGPVEHVADAPVRDSERA